MEKDGTKEGGMPNKEMLVITTSRSLLWEIYVDGLLTRRVQGSKLF